MTQPVDSPRRGRKPNHHSDQKLVRNSVSYLRRQLPRWADVEALTGVHRGTLCAVHGGRVASTPTGNKIIAAAESLKGERSRRQARAKREKAYTRPMIRREDAEALAKDGVTVADLVRQYLDRKE